MITDLQKLIQDSMKAKDNVRTTTLKMLSAEIHNAEIDKKGELDEKEQLAIIRREAKKRKDAIDAYDKVGATDRAKAEETELAILQEFLPEEMGDAELAKLVESVVKETGAKSMADMGKVIGSVMAKSNGTADGGKVSAKVKEFLSSTGE